MSFKLKVLSLSSLALLPMVTLAQDQTTFNGGYFTGAATSLATTIAYLIPAFMGLGFIAFFWFLFKFITSQATEKKQAKEGLIWSVVAIVLMVSIYGVASLAQGIFGASNSNTTITAPKIQ